MVKRVLYPSVSCGAILFKGKATQDKFKMCNLKIWNQEVACTRVDATRYKERDPRHQVIRQGEVLVKRALSPQLLQGCSAPNQVIQSEEMSQNKVNAQE